MPTESQFEDVESVQLKGEVKCSFRTGPAGSGKTFQFRQEIEADPQAGILCATTGVAAVNLNTTTVHSVLGFFNTESLADAYATRKLVRRMIQLRRGYGYRSLKIDEASMLGAYPLSIITQAAEDANARMHESGESIAIDLTGDFAQLPPVNEEWAFKSEKWPEYAKNITKLDKIYRQSDPEFLEALKLARAGNGPDAAEALRPLVKWTAGVDLAFDGTTIVATNDDVDSMNKLRYMKLPGQAKRFKSSRWGKQLGEWKNIPDEVLLKENALVMIMNNGYEFYTDPETLKQTRKLVYANGDTGKIVGMQGETVLVELKRNGQVVEVGYNSRNFETKDEPGKFDDPKAYLDEEKERWVLGGILRLPVRLAYAITCHKSQGLTMDSVQIDPRGHFFGSPNLAYVALSRARSPKHLKIVGTPEMLSRRINVSTEVGEWI